MPIPFDKYLKAKDRYCIGYFGNCAEYIVQLSYLRPHIEKQLTGLEIHLSCKDELYHLLSNQSNTWPWSIYKDTKREFGHVREMTSDLMSHPVLTIMEESSLQFPPPPSIAKPNTRCVLWTKGILPTKNLDPGDIPYFKNKLSIMGYEVVIDQPQGVGCVAGVESEFLYSSAAHGLMTYLIPTGIGTELYRKMFPNRGVLEKIYNGFVRPLNIYE